MSYIVDTDLFAINFLPSKKRLPRYKSWVVTLLKPLQILYNTMFGTYKDGNAANNWFLLTSYNVGDQVKFVDKAIYQCWVASGAGIEPTDTNFWFKIQDKFVGIEPRVKYNAQRLLLEWALNEWFGTTFVNTPGASDIYIGTATANQGEFLVGFTETESSFVVYDDAEATAYIQAINLTTVANSFSINVPLAVANALTNEPPDVVPNISSDRENIIRQIADLYVYAGINYNCITY